MTVPETILLSIKSNIVFVELYKASYVSFPPSDVESEDSEDEFEALS